MQSKFRKHLQHRRVRLALEFAVLLLIVFAVKTWMQRDMVEGIPPPIEGTLLNGEVFDLRSMGGKPVLLHFWATWCAICKLEQDSIEAISQDHTVITIAMQSGPVDDIKDYMSKHGLKFPVLADEQGDLARRYGVHAVPASFIINPAGRISFRETGYTTEWGLRVRLWLTQLF